MNILIVLKSLVLLLLTVSEANVESFSLKLDIANNSPEKESPLNSNSIYSMNDSEELVESTGGNDFKGLGPLSYSEFETNRNILTKQISLIFIINPMTVLIDSLLPRAPPIIS